MQMLSIELSYAIISLRMAYTTVIFKKPRRQLIVALETNSSLMKTFLDQRVVKFKNISKHTVHVLQI